MMFSKSFRFISVIFQGNISTLSRRMQLHFPLGHFHWSLHNKSGIAQGNTTQLAHHPRTLVHIPSTCISRPHAVAVVFPFPGQFLTGPLREPRASCIPPRQGPRAPHSTLSPLVRPLTSRAVPLAREMPASAMCS